MAKKKQELDEILEENQEVKEFLEGETDELPEGTEEISEEEAAELEEDESDEEDSDEDDEDDPEEDDENESHLTEDQKEANHKEKERLEAQRSSRIKDIENLKEKNVVLEKEAAKFENLASTIDTEPFTELKTLVIETIKTYADNTEDGLNIYLAECDEIHAWKGIELYNIVADGISARDEPLILITTTGGFVREGAYDLKYSEAENLINGLYDDEGYNGAIAVGIGLLIGGVVLLIRNWDKVKEAVTSFAAKAKAVITDLWQKVKPIFENIAKVAKIAFSFTPVGMVVNAAQKIKPQKHALVYHWLVNMVQNLLIFQKVQVLHQRIKQGSF